jgi:hypothetical protein
MPRSRGPPARPTNPTTPRRVRQDVDVREHDIEQFIRLESDVWEALATGNGEADGRLLSDDFLGVYTVGFADRAAHVAQLADGPTVIDYSLSEARLMGLSDDMALLAYRAQFRRTGEVDPQSVLISSIWQERQGRWVNIFSQDTPSADSSP